MAFLVIENGKEMLVEYDETRTDGVHFKFTKLRKGEIKKRTGISNPREAIRIPDKNE